MKRPRSDQEPTAVGGRRDQTTSDHATSRHAPVFSEAETQGLRDDVSYDSADSVADDVLVNATPGAFLGQRYRIERLLGEGGMGKVWLAYDLKLRVEVALKAVRPDRGDWASLKDRLREEVRAARRVISPHVCRIHDLIEIDGVELVSMEYVDGQTVLELLRAEGPMEISARAGEVASQLLAGLQAIHDSGLVHRDLKPENVMVTPSGRVVIMDLGLAKPSTDVEAGSIAGTAPYMSPEQTRGDPLGPPADVFSAAVMLAETVDPKAHQSRDARRRLWSRLRRRPPEIVASPWRPALIKALAPEPEDRFQSALDFSRALEDAQFGVSGDEEAAPYLGLESFGEAQADLFYGREAEIESMWKKLKQTTLLGVIGASGAGKSSFLRAGVMAARPQGWGAVYCTPGKEPFVSLGQALVTQLTSNTDALKKILSFEDAQIAAEVVESWRKQHTEALLVIDQFEELFTQCEPETAERFADFIGRVSSSDDAVHVIISMRDDFLIHCYDHPALEPIFRELTPLGPLTGEALRRALVQPALKLRYRFEDEGLIRELTAPLSRERGALPLVSFAASRLWELRDREHGLLTRAAYDEIGGVAGALAQHAESTLERLGPDRHYVVKEILANLATSQGTRLSRSVRELLALFDDDPQQRVAAREVLQELVDARLLTRYEAPSREGTAPGTHTRVEVVHESLFTAWPRLVGWRTRDGPIGLASGTSCVVPPTSGRIGDDPTISCGRAIRTANTGCGGTSTTHRSRATSWPLPMPWSCAPAHCDAGGASPSPRVSAC